MPSFVAWNFTYCTKCHKLLARISYHQSFLNNFIAINSLTIKPCNSIFDIFNLFEIKVLNLPKVLKSPIAYWSNSLFKSHFIVKNSKFTSFYHWQKEKKTSFNLSRNLKINILRATKQILVPVRLPASERYNWSINSNTSAEN